MPTARLNAFLAPWTTGVPAEQLRIVRVADYKFHAQLADRWRDRRVFLLGDAAHLTPPFIGQGMGAGLRDAANLAWKLAAVLAGDLPESVLTSYETERRPHARALSCSELVDRKAFRHGLAGRLCPNALLGDGRRLDHVAAGRFAFVTRRSPSDKVRATLNDRDVVLIVARPGDELHRWLRRWRAYGALVRPDGTVQRAGRRVIESIN